MEEVREQLVRQAQAARQAAMTLANVSTAVKNGALLAMAEGLLADGAYILQANAEDIQQARERGLPEAMVERLTLNEKRLAAMAEGIRQVAALPDPVGEVVEGWKRPNGLEILKVRVPLGVVAIIYESRPNVTADAAALCLKSGNAVILRGGSEAFRSNQAITASLVRAVESAGLPAACVQMVQTTDREAATQLMRLNGLVDCIVPRGGAGLIQTVMQTATVPVIETGVGNCHTYVHEDADLQMASEVAFNAKVQRPSVCNAMETLLVHSAVAGEFLPAFAERLRAAGVEIRGCERTRQLVPWAVPATEDDWYTEYLALILAVKVVDSLDEAIAHINHYGSRHSEAIITRSLDAARRFTREVDAACVYVNASTRFTDGFEFGFGAEVGISTQKLHARGPMGLRELTTTKYVVYGNGQVRT
ncbi:MAG: glutamate-5-semialdehyde dehydrogenase [Armatimonadota bacterium]|nr:glutamate-5-semialdehyde dehydrogenase [bacterium]MCS7309827.1 glutamate-5-semialdehyde dehydrogenase [Armatimonadota bacterium]MDW8105271.1 glutamate-5-semialdehyde dehydrogenase [Armatimonadota bacterium]MDW8291149.1 glutamate-5-semialdehyde dehydrogenase [Armatimonadota bacterium]